MKKKILLFLISAFMVFGLVACDGIIGNDLARYKTDAETALETYAEAKGHDNYTDENWSAISGIVADGKAEIKAAADKPAVDNVVDEAKDAINEIPPKTETELTEELKDRIKADYFKEFGHELFFGEELLNKFYGLYNEAAVFFIVGAADWNKVVTISGVEFGYKNSWTILVWKDGVFYDLEEIETIFDAGVLTQKDLEKIGIIHAEANAKEGNMDIKFTLSLGRMDYGSDTSIEVIVKSIDEWKAMDTIASLPELIGKYDERFFAGDALIVFALGRGTRGAQFERVEVFGQGGELVVKVFDDECGYMDALSNWIVVIEVKKADIDSFENLRLETNFYSYNQ